MNKYFEAFKRFYRQLDNIVLETGMFKIYILAHMFYCFILYGSTPNDYLHYEFYKKKHCERRKFITRRKTLYLEKKLNNPNNSVYFNNKYEFNVKFKDFVKRDWIYMENCTFDEFKDFAKKYDNVLIKPIDLSSGRGIELYKYDNNSIKKIYEKINKKKILVEEKVENHMEIKKFNPSSANTIRIYTLIKKEGGVDILNAIIRIGAKGKSVDNYHSGGVCAAIDINTGIIYTQLVDVNGNKYKVHPTNNVEIIGKKIPMWNELIKNVKQAAMVFPDSRYIGWDICITKDGFEYIEGNYDSDPGVLQSADQIGKYYMIKKEI